MKNIGKKIKQVRNSYGYTQKNFGEFLGVSSAHISKIEAGKDYPSKTLIQIICTKFNVDEMWLTGDEDSTYTPRVHNNNFLKDNFQQLIEEYNMSEGSALQKIGLSSSDYSLLKSGSPNVDIHTLIKVSDFFDVSLDWLLKGEEHSTCYSTDLNIEAVNLLKSFKMLDKKEKELVKSLIEKFITKD